MTRTELHEVVDDMHDDFEATFDLLEARLLEKDVEIAKLEGYTKEITRLHDSDCSCKPTIQGAEDATVSKRSNNRTYDSDANVLDTNREGVISITSDDGVDKLVEQWKEHRPFPINQPLVDNVNPNHYTDMVIPPHEYITANNLEWEVANCVKYVSRYDMKNGKEDLLKAIKYIEMLIDRRYS